MARPKVPDDQRQRASAACVFCKTSKKRCDSQLPCGHCVRKGRAASCHYRLPAKRHKNVFPHQLLEAPTPPLTASDTPISDFLSTAPSMRSFPATTVSTTSGDEESVAMSNATAPPQPISAWSRFREPCLSPTQQPRMLNPGKGEKVLVGSMATISFLQFIRKTLRRYSGPSTFSEGVKQQSMLEIPAPDEDHQDPGEADIAPVDRARLIQCFLQVKHVLTQVAYAQTSGILYIFTPDKLSRLLAALNKPELTLPPDDLAAVYLMLAIGARCNSSDHMDQRLSSFYFSRAQKLGFRDMLQQPSLGMVINFTLMSFYMLCDCRRNSASLYLGVACRSASILGLHSPVKDEAWPIESQRLRARVWRSLCVLDIQLSTILGRPSGTGIAELQQEIDPQMRKGDSDHFALALNASFSLSCLVNAISQRLTADQCPDIHFVEGYLQSLRGWAQCLPEVLRQDIQTGHQGVAAWKHQAKTLGSIHVACSYYFAVFLITRQFLVAKVIRTLESQEGGLDDGGAGGGGGGGAESETYHKTNELSRACVGAATYLIQMCHDAFKEGMLRGNMCILQSWVFAAGLILGFSLLGTPEGTSEEVQESFNLSRQIVDHLSSLSPQAQRDSELLCGFAEALDAHRRHRQIVKPPAAGGVYLEKIVLSRPDTIITQAHVYQTPAPTDADNESLGVIDPPAPPQYDILDNFQWISSPEEFIGVEMGNTLTSPAIWDEYAYNTPQLGGNVDLDDLLGF